MYNVLLCTQHYNGLIVSWTLTDAVNTKNHNFPHQLIAFNYL